MSSSAHENPAFDDNEITKETNESRISPKRSEEETEPDSGRVSSDDITYGIEDVPPWYMCALLGMQHYMTMIGSTVTIPFILTPLLCIADDDPARGKIVSSILFVSGIVTLMQTTVGVRLPIIQGGTFGFLLPTIAILTSLSPPCESYDFATMSPDETDEVWMARMREIQGAIIVASFVQVFLGFSGLIGILMNWITPLTIVPTVTLVGLSLFRAAAHKASEHWGIAFMTTFFLILFSQYLSNVQCPIPAYKKNRGFYFAKVEIFKLFPVILALVISWGICGILTATDALPVGSPARTDLKLAVIAKSPWFYIPYPFQWGVPTVSLSSVLGMLAGVLSSMIESLGDYYACARLSGIVNPPSHAMNRGIGIEGIGCIIAGIIGSGNGTTSYSENIGAIRVTKVASRRVVQYGATFMVLFALFGKFGACFVTIPTPVVGGIFLVMFAIITAVGLSNLQLVNLNSSRNLFVLGFSLFCGIAIPEWINSNKNAIQTGSPILDQVLTVLLSTHMFVGGFLGFILDNTIPGTDEDRGLNKWNIVEQTSEEGNKQMASYDLPFGMTYLKSLSWASKIPFSPTYVAKARSKRASVVTRIVNKIRGYFKKPSSKPSVP